ncbi:MAG: hypothetical protein GPJ54_08150 [Candidatus Heimdallarchaeota archaeon]|nr:hypothetical protein [Candidatus Heimdallarchaeota archaeon]
MDEINHFIEHSQYEKAIKLINDTKNLHPSDTELIHLQVLENRILRYLGDVDIAAQQLRELISPDLLEMNPTIYLFVIAEYAYTLFYQNEYNDAEELCKRGLELLNKLNINMYSYQLGTEGTFYHVLGVIHLRKLRLGDSYESLLKAFNLRKTHGSNLEFGYANMNLGILYYFKGELQISKIYLKSSIEILEQLDNQLTMSVAKSYLGVVEILIGNVIDGEQHLIESISLTKSTGNILLVTEPYYELAYVCLLRNRVSEAKTFIDRMGDLLENNENDVVRLRYDFITAFYLKKKGRLKFIAKAQEKFLNIIHRPVLDTMIYVNSIKHYCDLLIDEVKLSENSIVLDEVKIYINKLYDIGRENGAMSIVVESMILKSKIALLEENPTEMLEILESAKIVGDAYKLTQLIKIIDLEILRFADQIQRWESMKSQSVQSDDNSFREYLTEIQDFMRKSELRHLE